MICMSLVLCSVLYLIRYQILFPKGTRIHETLSKTTSSALQELFPKVTRIHETFSKTTSSALHVLFPKGTRVNETFTKTTSSALHREQGSQPNDFPDVLTFVDNHWKHENLCKPYKMFLNHSDFLLLRYTTNAGSVKIFTHSLKDGMSLIISRSGAFELKTINRVLYQLEQDPNMNLIDIGTNIGQHSIAAAMIGRDSIAIDNAISNIEHACASAEYLNIGSRITLIHNILSDSSGKRMFRYSATHTDFGVNHVDSDGIWDKMKKKFYEFNFGKTVQENSTTLDNLFFLPQIQKFQKVFVKMDVEGHEHRVLLGAKNFFKQLDVHGIIMEWTWHVKRPSSKIIKTLMTEWNFKPFEFFENTESDLSSINSDLWPPDVLWLPMKMH
ncbi:unnamed protein product [Mytilus coruscus]|uniref:Methyltransferase FkbM domain-containing protein n=1 Tax=Mytilus coruscus TaxID=42192 RepID=A0A6J8C568_MYTCO|nr:unnamed protein product [Mytilus coruscus]